MQTLLKQATIINENKRYPSDLLIEAPYIKKIDKNISAPGAKEINAEDLLLLPGAIDDQVHFREPGLTHKADIHSESKAAVAGGTTSYMEMPNTIPAACSHELLEDKYSIAAQKSIANYSFYLGGAKDNLDAVKAIDPKKICGLKIFMGSSTGNLIVDSDEALNKLFRHSPVIIATHCEDTPTIEENTRKAQERWGDDIPMSMHPKIRSAEACLKSSTKAVKLAQENHARLHILHISTALEVQMLAGLSELNKSITAEACLHHLFFSEEDYERLGSRIKWNPAVKSLADRTAVRKAAAEGVLSVFATDHAPHLLEEKNNLYTRCPSGGPLIQHALPAWMDMASEGLFSYETVVERCAHAPASLFQVQKRGFIREGYFADLVLIKNESQQVRDANILSKCKWSPFNGRTLQHKVASTWVNGLQVYDGKNVLEPAGKRLVFDR